MADSEMARRGDGLQWKEGGKAKWDITPGLFTLSLLKLAGRPNDPRYVQFAKDTIGSFITPDGSIRVYKLERLEPRQYQCRADGVGPLAAHA